MTALQTRIQQADLASLPDWEVADILNTPDATLPPVFKSVEKAEILTILITSDKWVDIDTLSRGDLTQPINRICRNAYDALTIGNATLNLTDPSVLTSFQTILGGVILAGVIDEPVQNALLTAVTRYPSWAEYNNIEVTARTVGIARGGIA